MNEEIKPENVRIHSRADELIACLEGEIAKRDEVIVGLTNSRDFWREKAIAADDELAAIKAQGVVMLSRDAIREVFMRNGFTVKEGQTDLKPYVYAAAEELLRLSAPVQQVSVPTHKMILAGEEQWERSGNEAPDVAAIFRAMLAAAPAAPAADAPPENCRQRLASEGKPYPKSSCAACGQFSPKWRECDAALAAHSAQVVVR